jgi:hypothetical protein
LLLAGMVARQTACLRKAADGERGRIVQFNRFLGNPKVTVERLIDHWGELTGLAAAGRHVLAIQDTSEIGFRTSAGRRRGLGEIGKGNAYGLLLHAMIALDAENGQCLGLVDGRIYTRQGRQSIPHGKRALSDRESMRWLATARAAGDLLGERAASVTVIADRESDIYDEGASLPQPGLYLLTRAMKDRRLAGGGKLFAAAAGFAVAGRGTVDLAARPGRPARRAEVELRYGEVAIRRPDGSDARLPENVTLRLVQVVEPAPPPGAEPVCWHLLTTHAVEGAEAAWCIVAMYKRRWVIEQFFRLLKSQGLGIEDSQIESAERLIKLTAIAARAAVVTLQLVQSRDGRTPEPASLVFDEVEIEALEAVAKRSYAPRTKLQTNPHPPQTLAWAAWIIARLGGWDGYPRTKPGPITMANGLKTFQAILIGWRARDV